MAISNLGGSSDKWVEIATSSPTSGTTVSFTSVPEYKDLAVFAYNINNGGSSTSLTVRFNNDTGSNYSRNVLYDTGTTTEILSTAATTAVYGTREGTAPAAFQLIIEGANSPFKKINGAIYDVTGFETNGAWHSANVINQVDVISSATYSAGTIKLFGRN